MGWIPAMVLFLFHTGRFCPSVHVRNNEKQIYLFDEHLYDCLGVLLLNTIIGLKFFAVVSPVLNITIFTIVAIFPFFAINIVSFLTLSFTFICMVVRMTVTGGVNC